MELTYLASCIPNMLVRLTPLMIVVVDIHAHACTFQPVLGYYRNNIGTVVLLV